MPQYNHIEPMVLCNPLNWIFKHEVHYWCKYWDDPSYGNGGGGEYLYRLHIKSFRQEQKAKDFLVYVKARQKEKVNA
tara:strand:- start:391 stop:621 length:231 start_codon:yes stop_codon:yes gene_type:complete